MGKDLKGKELGVGISQRKDGFYTGRILINGKRVQKYFKKLQECRQWMADAQFQKEHGTINAGADMTVNSWFDYWMNDIKGDSIRKSTKNVVNTRYEKNIKEYIGEMALSDVKPLHCQNILNRMLERYKISSIEMTRWVLQSFFESAVENEIIQSNPVKKSVKVQSSLEEKEPRVLTADEQRVFLEASKKCSYSSLFRLALQTGMRAGELIGLKWEDIDFPNGMITVNRSSNYISKEYGRVESDPKTECGKRKIPLTGEAINALKEQKERNGRNKTVSIEWKGYVFLSKEGNVLSKSNIDKQILRICRKAGIERFSMHTLRHTFATRCIESGMNPKVLQTILGHANITTTMDLYVHSMDDEKKSEIRKIESGLKIVV